MEHHCLELSYTLIPDFCVRKHSQPTTHGIGPFELAMLSGSMVHPMSSFSVDFEGTSLAVEWVQEFPC